MSRKQDFIKKFNEWFFSKGESIILSVGKLDGEALAREYATISLKTSIEFTR